MKYDVDVSDKGILELLDVLYDIDLFIGIGSCFGQLCSLIGIPSVSIFINHDIYQQYFYYKHMPMSRNYSLFAIDNYIPAELVYEKMQNILQKRILLSSVYIPLEQRREYQQYEFYKP